MQTAMSCPTPTLYPIPQTPSSLAWWCLMMLHNHSGGEVNPLCSGRKSVPQRLTGLWPYIHSSKLSYTTNESYAMDAILPYLIQFWPWRIRCDRRKEEMFNIFVCSNIDEYTIMPAMLLIIQQYLKQYFWIIKNIAESIILLATLPEILSATVPAILRIQQYCWQYWWSAILQAYFEQYCW